MGVPNILASAYLFVKRATSRYLWEHPARTLEPMARPKTITDEAILSIAREAFRERGHTATTREIAEKAGISEAILYQRFSNKEELFFASMRPTNPDLDELLGPESPGEDAANYLVQVVLRIGKYLSEIIPLALHVMTHPAFDPGRFSKANPMASAIIREGLTIRLRSLAAGKKLKLKSVDTTARLLVSLAHDWALGNALTQSSPSRRENELKEMVQIVWQGLRAS